MNGTAPRSRAAVATSWTLTASLVFAAVALFLMLPSARGSTSTTTASSAGSVNVDFTQCSNENPTLGSCNWINGILQQNNSRYLEGMSTGQRLLFDGIAG